VARQAATPPGRDLIGLDRVVTSGKERALALFTIALSAALTLAL